ncbi:pentatricopeptide repeat-containing protein At5g44230 [Euphorbia lathyris]|uniref:pentatricopeptide repeat-containing protein At5g44230 n=1 Tax=Euphorbia lathyris TaxID=212925 RepID=UPI003313105F
MTTFSRKFFSTRPSFISYLPKQLPQHIPVSQPTPIFIPFSQLQQQLRLLESHINSTLDACTSLSQIKQVHSHILCQGLHQCSYVITKLVRTLTNLNVPMEPYPRSIFHQVQSPNPFLYSAVIRGYSIQGPLSESVRVYSLMRSEGVGPVSFTFSAILKACGGLLDVKLGRQMHTQSILIGGLCSDLFVMNTLIDMYVKCGFLECGRKVFDEMPQKDVISWTEIIVAYTKIGDMKSASQLFDDFPSKDMVAWTAMVTGFAQNAKPREAIECFERMLDAGVRTDEVTLVGVVSACAQLGTAEYADWIGDIAQKLGAGSGHDVVLGSALIDMYSKCGNIDVAYKVFSGLKYRNVFSYSSMIMGFAVHGRAESAIKMFNEMVKTDIEPNDVTFIGVLTACVHSRLVDEALRMFELMEKCYGVKPTADHYTCIVDVLGRAGRLNEALELVKTMPIQPHAGVWGALLGACRIHRNPDIASIAASHLFELEPNGIGNYVILSNIYASAGRFLDESDVRELMRKQGLKKNPGCSWIEATKGVIHEFFSGDLTHPMSTDIKQVLMDLLGSLEGSGYQPYLNSVPYDVADEEKRRILMTHSEKLALAFGLISMNPGSTIRIMKNLRICEDCHLVMCGASQITGREIVVRDNSRFHHFRDGTCSCGDFW